MTLKELRERIRLRMEDETMAERLAEWVLANQGRHVTYKSDPIVYETGKDLPDWMDLCRDSKGRYLTITVGDGRRLSKTFNLSKYRGLSGSNLHPIPTMRQLLMWNPKIEATRRRNEARRNLLRPGNSSLPLLREALKRLDDYNWANARVLARHRGKAESTLGKLTDDPYVVAELLTLLK
jgi:hypothetical protein